MKRKVEIKYKKVNRKTLNDNLITKAEPVINNIRVTGLDGHDYIVNANRVPCYQLLDDYNKTCSDTGFDSGTSPCHIMYMTAAEHDSFYEQGIVSNINQTKTGVNDSKAFLRQEDIQDLIESQVYSNQIIGFTYLNPVSANKLGLNTSYSQLNSKMKISFTAPATGNVLIDLSFFRDSVGSNITVYAALADSSSKSLGKSFEKKIHKADEVDDVIVNHSWVLTGLNPGDSLEYNILLKADDTRLNVTYGGESPPFIVKATVIPANLLT